MGCSSSTATVPLDDIVISIFGLDNSGKTCFLRSLSGDFNFDTVPTVGLGQRTFMFDDIQLTVYDLGGNSKFRSVWERFYAEIWGFIFLVDSSDPLRFEESKNTLNQMLKHKMLEGKPFIVVANKQDKEGSINSNELKNIFQLSKKIQFIDASVIQINETENKCNIGVTNSVNNLINEVIKNFKNLSKKRSIDMEEQRIFDEKERDEKRKRIEKMKEEREKNLVQL